MKLWGNNTSLNFSVFLKEPLPPQPWKYMYYKMLKMFAFTSPRNISSYKRIRFLGFKNKQKIHKTSLITQKVSYILV
jgi:hypothetical protein